MRSAGRQNCLPFPCLPIGCVQEAQLDALVGSLRMSGADLKQGLQRMARDKECSEQEVSERREWLGWAGLGWAGLAAPDRPCVPHVLHCSHAAGIRPFQHAL